MSAALATYSKLMDDSAVTAIVVDRVFPQRSPQAFSGTYPQIIYDLKEIESVTSYTGRSGLTKQSIMVACLATDYLGSLSLAIAVRDSLDAQSGTWGGIVVQGAFLEGRNEVTFQIGEQADAKILYATELQFAVWYAE